jgi:hypothetical protein
VGGVQIMCTSCNNTGYRKPMTDTSECSFSHKYRLYKGGGSYGYSSPCVDRGGSGYDDPFYPGDPCKCDSKKVKVRCGCGCCKDKGGCFITEATLSSLQKDDDCYELASFRKFRDTYLKENNPELIEEYYQVAPKIVAKINEQPTRENLYREIWGLYLQECLKLIEANKEKEALNCYQSMVLKLKTRFLN